MNFSFTSVVAAFLLGSVLAERNGPTNVLMSRRRSGGRMIRLKNDNQMNAGRQSRAFTLTGTRISQGKLPGPMTSNDPFITSGGYEKNRRSEIDKNSRKFYGRRINQSRRSLDLGTHSEHISIPKIIRGDAIFLEPIVKQTSKKDFFSYLFDKVFTPDPNDELGPSIGPLNFPGIGRNVHIRLMVSPDKETSSHVTVHVVNREPTEIFSDFTHPGKEEPLFFLDKNPGTKTLALVKSNNNNLATGSIPVLIPNSRRGRFSQKSVHNFGLTRTRPEPERFVGVPNPREISQEISNQRPVPFGNPGLGQHPAAAPNHHQLPISYRPAGNQIDLPIYPPLSLGGYKNEGNAKDEGESDVLNADSQQSVENIGDNQQSASSKHAFISRNYLISPTAQKAFRVSFLPKPEVALNREESPEPVFIQEIKAPDLSGGNISSIVHESPRRESRRILISTNDREYRSMESRIRNSSVIQTPEEDENGAISNSDFAPNESGLEHTTTSITNNELSQDDSRYGNLRSTTPNPSKIETSSAASLIKMKS